MQFAKMRHRIILQHLQATKDSRSGELYYKVISNTTVWAEVKTAKLSDAQQSAAGGMGVMGVQSFVIRYRSDINAEEWRIKDSSNMLWDIIDIPRVINNREGLELLCQRTGKTEQTGIIDLTSIMLGGVAND